MIFKKHCVSIVIPTHNRKGMLGRLIESILNSSYKNIEIIVVDDASEDGTYEFVKSKFKTVRVIRNKKNLFTAHTRNIGLNAAKGEYIFFIDDDNILDKNTVSILVESLDKDPKLGEVGPVNYSSSNKKVILWSRTIRNMLTSKTNQSRDLKPFGGLENLNSDDIPNAFMVRANVVKNKKIRFNNIFGIMYEESDFAYKIHNLGYKIQVIRDAKIYHDIERNVGGKKVQDYMYHFMTDLRRPYVFARNRLLFHKMYSNKLQFFFILSIWVWFFAAYYLYKMLFYSGTGSFSLIRRITLAKEYIKGTFDGIYLSV